MATTKIKCPVEGIIDLDRLPGVPPERVEALIDAPELQRLRRIKQLGFSELVYPGATHSRYAHSLGAYQGAQRTLTQLRLRGVDLPDEWYVATALACLLHDLGHGPFSHTFEAVTGQKHELRTQRLVQAGPRVPQLLEEIGPGTTERVLALLRAEIGEAQLRFLADLVSSALDCDRMDYLRRDALYTGAQYGTFDRDWLIREITPTDDGAAIVVIEKGRTAVEQYLIGRYHMFRNVYLHKTSRGFEGAFRMLCQRLKKLGPTALPAASRAFGALQGGSALSDDHFLALSDTSFQAEIDLLVQHDDLTVRRLARALHDRIPLRQRTSRTDDDATGTSAVGDLDALREKRQEQAAEAGLDPDCAVWKDTAQDVPYRPYAPEEGRKGLRILRRDGALVDITEVSPSIRALSQKMVLRRVYWIGTD